MRNPLKRREPYRFVCVAPGCDGVFFTVSVSLTKRCDKFPDIESVNGELTCTKCGWKQGYDHHVAISRGRQHLRRDAASASAGAALSFI